MERVIIEVYSQGQNSVHLNALVPVTMTEAAISRWVKANMEYVLWIAAKAPTPSLLVLPYGRLAHA